MIIETILSTLDSDGKTHFAPVGVIFPDDMEHLGKAEILSFKLYAGSRTYENLRARGEGVVNLTGNVLYFADAALRKICETYPSNKVKPHRLADAGVFWEFSVSLFDAGRNPALVTAKVLTYEQRLGFFTGFCRAQGAVLEAAVAASRRDFLPRREIETPWPVWREIVEKTGSAREKQAFQILSKKLTGEGFSLTREDLM